MTITPISTVRAAVERALRQQQQQQQHRPDLGAAIEAAAQALGLPVEVVREAVSAVLAGVAA